ncbi:PLP-dependent aspartate aminotransferase family protein [Fibrobacter sp. HC4]|uniref:trans-sulfuration enzyme family protein n=1 Tax=Fibrobacter sp. HC4 TaxID=3239812 RepID=UPI002019B6F5|nr:PLP-dependent aspartate aminotransferase family protein [Fibrobacter succinogenes]MCL4103202.1 Cystathionine beta-lyase [Fibrobacter succinogenes]
MSLGIETRCIHGDLKRFDKDSTGSISFPIYQTATFAHRGVGKSTGFDYSRLQNPTREQLEKIVASLEGGIDALAYSSGMAAITALFEIFEPGDNVIIDSDLYGGSIRLFDNVSKKNGLEITRVNFAQDNIENFIKPNTKALYFETPTNPMMNIVSVRRIAGIAKTHGILCIVDNTFLSPYFLQPLKLGADIVIESGTKFLCGHNDTLAGFLATSRQDIAEKFRFLIKTVGSGLAPFDSWLLLRGIKTLPIRMERQSQNAFEIAKWLRSNKHVKKVYYPGFEDYPGHDILKDEATGFGSMITFEVESRELALYILENVKLVQFAESLGGVESLITYPITQTHADVPRDVLEKNGITPSVLRLSVGTGNVKDLIADFENAIVELHSGNDGAYV